MFKIHINNSMGRGFSDSFRQDNLIRLNLLFGLLLNVLLWFFIFSQIRNFFEMIPLHYNIYFGIDLLDYWYKIFRLPALSLGFLILNYSLAFLAYQQEKILSYFLAGFTTFIQLIFILSTFLVIWINF